MIKEIAWETFKNTGNIETFLEFKKIDDIQKSFQENYLNQELDIRKE